MNEFRESLNELKGALDEKKIKTLIAEVVERELQLAQEIRKAHSELPITDILSKVDDIVMRILDWIRQRKKGEIMANFCEKARSAFCNMYFTLLSIIQGVALSFLGYNFFVARSIDVSGKFIFHPLLTLFAVITFAILIAVWYKYAYPAVLFTWIPGLTETILAFLIGVCVISLSFSIDSPALWSVLFSGLCFFSILALFNTLQKSRFDSLTSNPERANEDLSKWTKGIWGSIVSLSVAFLFSLVFGILSLLYENVFLHWIVVAILVVLFVFFIFHARCYIKEVLTFSARKTKTKTKESTMAKYNQTIAITVLSAILVIAGCGRNGFDGFRPLTEDEMKRFVKAYPILDIQEVAFTIQDSIMNEYRKANKYPTFAEEIEISKVVMKRAKNLSKIEERLKIADMTFDEFWTAFAKFYMVIQIGRLLDNKEILAKRKEELETQLNAQDIPYQERWDAAYQLFRINETERILDSVPKANIDLVKKYWNDIMGNEGER